MTSRGVICYLWPYPDWGFFYPDWGFSTLIEGFPCFYSSCKANARVQLAKTGHGPHSSQILCFSMYCFFVLFYVLFVCKCVLYCCHRVSTQLQFKKYIVYHIISYQYNDAVHLVQQLYKSLSTLSKVTRSIVLPGTDIIHLTETISHNRIDKLLWASYFDVSPRCSFLPSHTLFNPSI
jgi:hypothetical protein